MTEPLSAARQVAALTKAAMSTMDRTAGVSARNRPPHLAQLHGVLEIAVQQAKQVETNPAAADRDADLWRLREPGYLRAICEHPPAHPGNALVLLPVVLTWSALGVAEWRYVEQYTSSDPGARPSFFADWLSQPWYLGPVMLSLVIVVTVLWIMLNHRRTWSSHRRADTIDRVAHQLEVDLLPPLAVLRAQLGTSSPEQQTREAAATLAGAAQRLGEASSRLAAASEVVDRLGAVARELVAALPDLARQVDAFSAVQQRFGDQAREIVAAVAPLETVVADVGVAAALAREASVTSGEVVRAATVQTSLAHDLSTRNAAHRDLLEEAQKPFSAAADSVAGAADRFQATVSALQETTGKLRETIREVNWLAMVSDGLRHPTEHPDHAQPRHTDPPGHAEPPSHGDQSGHTGSPGHGDQAGPTGWPTPPDQASPPGQVA
ncbi:hypothetical protein ACIRG5_35750 [Lentzea sp. NPDC102401]|uniref:hypothetical protein n=1 Tax=Lentzea sp. NPDC102401 TaxID=3364128 RepID=UPI0038159F27